MQGTGICKNHKIRGISTKTKKINSMKQRLLDMVQVTVPIFVSFDKNLKKEGGRAKRIQMKHEDHSQKSISSHNGCSLFGHTVDPLRILIMLLACYR